MIKITPYYDRNDKTKNQILAYYLNLVADAVPFRPEDVLVGVEEAPDSRSHAPRTRARKKPGKDEKENATSPYKTLLDRFLDEEEKKASPRDQDAILAQKIIHAYSTELHKKLYKNPSSEKPGAVNRDALRRLLTTAFPHGKVPDDLRFSEQTPGSAALLRDNVFRYEEFSKKRPEGKRSVYHILSMLGVSVCPYCNRQYITTVAHGRQSVRPQIDHFNNKKDYPYLALSINNLIPSCGVCNLQKSDQTKEILYPYDEELGDNFVFRARFKKQFGKEAQTEDLASLLQNAGADAERFDLSPQNKTENQDGARIITSLLQGADDALATFCIELEQNGENLDENYIERAKNSVSVLALDQLYQSHKDYVSSLFFQRYIFTEDYFTSTAAQFDKLFKTADDVKHTLRLMDYSPDAWGNRPLAKLTHDIAEQIDRLYLEKST